MDAGSLSWKHLGNQVLAISRETGLAYSGDLLAIFTEKDYVRLTLECDPDVWVDVRPDDAVEMWIWWENE